MEKCKQVNQDINPKSFSLKKPNGRVAPKTPERCLIRAQQQEPYTAKWVADLIEEERKNAEGKDKSRSSWVQKVVDVAHKLTGIATELKPVVDIFVSSSLEFSVIYACLWVVFKVRHPTDAPNQPKHVKTDTHLRASSRGRS